MNRADDLIERLQARIVELERFEFAYNEWHDKTEWVQSEVSAGVIGFRALGRHRADVMSDLVADLRLELAALKAQQPIGVVDERTAFEAFVRSEWPGVMMHKRDALPIEHERYGEYVNAFLAHAWDAWQARARLNPCRAQSVQVNHDSDFSTNNHGVPELLGPCDCSAAAPSAQQGKPALVECDACPTSGGCVDVCMKAQQGKPAKKGCTKPGCFPFCDCGSVDDAPAGKSVGDE